VVLLLCKVFAAVAGSVNVRDNKLPSKNDRNVLNLFILIKLMKDCLYLDF
jgi:hypothetical protein